MTKLIAIDFDGVLHSYTSKWKGLDKFDDPVEGAVPWLKSLIHDDRFTATIFSTRCGQPGGTKNLILWFMAVGLTDEEVRTLHFSATKPPAFVFIDDRALKFDGVFPSADCIALFKTWQEP